MQKPLAIKQARIYSQKVDTGGGQVQDCGGQGQFRGGQGCNVHR